MDRGKVAAALSDTGGAVAPAARKLGISRAKLRHALDKDAELATLAAKLRAGEAEAETSEADEQARLREVAKDAELASLRREKSRLEKALANRQVLVDRIIEEARVPVPVPEFTPLPRKRGLPTRSAVLPLYDLQYGQKVAPSDTPLGIGEFNAGDIFDARLTRYFEAATASLRDLSKGHNIPELVIPVGGDQVEGDNIFKGQVWQLDSHPIRQVLDLRAKLRGMLRELIAEARKVGVERVGLYMIPGNHGKVGGKMSGATPTDYSWDHLLNELLAEDLQGHAEQIAVEPAGYLLFETGGHRFLMIHGDEVRGHMGIPFYGLSRFDARALRLVGEEAFFHFCLLGHHHQQSNIPNGHTGRYLMSGDWVGANNLSKHLASATQPQQRLFLVSEKYGLTHDVPLYLTVPRDRPKATVYSLADAA